MDLTTGISLGALAVALLAMKFLPRLIAGVPFVSPLELKSKMDRGEELLVVDVRTESEFTGDLGHVPGAMNLPLGQLHARLGQVKTGLEPFRSTPVFVMCRTSNRSAQAAKMLRQAGLTNLSVVDGGMGLWKRKGLPSTRGA
ncbi:MAG: rhodanese-like domain-containing protein [Alphaproteobacteria bacterium]|nr:rhodanese-like domain-containing protein [Alphaproteobacteria bacterium]MBF0129092.1 rhodanese-like domain-containing protein [Alphaproteobacteria bacterium]